LRDSKTIPFKYTDGAIILFFEGCFRVEKIRRQEYNRNSDKQIEKSDPFQFHRLFQCPGIILFNKVIVKLD